MLRSAWIKSQMILHWKQLILLVHSGCWPGMNLFGLYWSRGKCAYHLKLQKKVPSHGEFNCMARKADSLRAGRASSDQY